MKSVRAGADSVDSASRNVNSDEERRGLSNPFWGLKFEITRASAPRG
ncbi:hypothetical protein SAMN05216215_103185 [Saccharopolyspora shandongensis]|uniref:Uncharacterized protein n=1 Tax=Saccharopolyspora shandongensis TaxID=418495 RepID=A0A1H3LIG7_9PSEU|nr:hypothetical protein SAMN05216215_103185 [Saccharopolyspora shandongensis]